MALPSVKNNAPQSKSEALRELAPLLNIGMELAATVGLFGVIGWFIDKYAETSPFWLVALLIFGTIGGMVKFIRTVMKVTEQQSSAKITKLPSTSADKDSEQYLNGESHE